MDIITAINFPFHAVQGVGLSFGASAISKQNEDIYGGGISKQGYLMMMMMMYEDFMLCKQYEDVVVVMMMNDGV